MTVANEEFTLESSPDYFLFGHQNTTHQTWRIDTVTAVHTNMGATGYNTGASGMGTSRARVYGPGGVSYPAGTHFGLLRTAASNSPDNTNGDWVYVVATNDGHVTPVVKTSRLIDGRGIAFGPDGSTLFVIEDSGKLSTINTVTGVVTLVGTSVHSASLEWDPATQQFVAIAGQYLWHVNPADGAWTQRGRLGFGACTIARGPAGAWFTINSGNGQLRRIHDLTTGSTTIEGTNSSIRNICGTAFAPERVINEPPTGDPGGPYTGVEGSPVSFQGSGTDPEGGPLAYEWDFGDGNTASGPSVQHTYGDNDVYTVMLTVTDQEDIGVSVTTTATILNAPPVVDAGEDTRVDFGDPFTLDGSFTDPGFGDTWTWEIDWGDGNTLTGATSETGAVSASYTFGASGDYVVTLTVTDDDGASDSDQVTVEVGPMPVVIDIKPGSFPNSIGRNKQGSLPVAILSEDGFDATTVVPESVTLGNEDGDDTPVATKKKGQLHASIEDVDGDGDMDLMLHFDVPALFENGDLENDSTELVLLGETDEGREIRGVDSVRMVGKAK